MISFQSLKERGAALAQSRWGKRVRKAANIAFVIGVIGWLGYQLSEIGWADVWASRPRTPWFYVLWAALYLQLPLIESGIYRTLWGLPVHKGLLPIFQKRALNHDVVSYAGEAYFFTQARQQTDCSDAYLAGTLKDNAIASSLGSATAAVFIIGIFLYTGQIVLTDLIGDTSPIYVAFGGAAAAVLLALGLRFRQALFTLPARSVVGLFGVHFGRFVLLIYVMRLLQWWVVLPEVPLSTWATMLAVMTTVRRLPLLPAKDLVGIGAVLGMTELLAASASTIAAMLLVHSALNKALNFTLFVVASLVERRRAAANVSDAVTPDPAEKV